MSGKVLLLKLCMIEVLAVSIYIVEYHGRGYSIISL